MLKSFKLKLQLPIVKDWLGLYRLDQLLDIVLCQKGTVQYSHDLINASVEFKFSFNDFNSGIRDDSYINLYPYSILCISPEGLDAQMFLLRPICFYKERQFPWPSEKSCLCSK